MEKIPADLLRGAINKIVTIDDEEILKIEEIPNFNFKPMKGTYDWERCARCGEVVFSTGLRVTDGKHYCIPCSKL